MAIPWLALGKLVVTNLDTIASVAKPLFTRKKVESLPSQTDLLNQQISELQTASSSNAEQVKELAAQLKQVVTALEQAAENADNERRMLRRLAIGAGSVAVAALIVAIVSAWVR